LAEARIAASYSPDERVVVHEGDALGLLRDLPDGLAKLIVTSPPYNLGKSYERRVGVGEYLRAQEALIAELIRVLHPRGSLCWEVGNYVEAGEVYPLDALYYPIFKAKGLKLRNRIIWRFGHGLHCARRFSGRYEVILWLTKGDDYTFNLDPVRVPAKYPGKRHYKGPRVGQPSGNPRGKNPSDVWEVVAADWAGEVWDIPNVKANHPEKTAHPCQFPVELVERCVLALTDPDDWVLDPYCGVGSSLLAAVRHSRRAVGAEVMPEYASAARDRIRRLAEGTLAIRPLGRPIHEPTGRERVSRRPEEWEET
jgi:DNA modification methylase